MHTINKSSFPTEEHENAFQRLCNSYIEECRIHAAHMKMVAKDPKNYHPYPAPSVHPDISGAVTQDGDEYNVEYEIVDDITPPPPPVKTLEERKNLLVVKISHDASKAIEEFIPPLKQKLWAMDINRILGKPEEERTKEEVAKLDDFQLKMKMQEAIHYKLAVAESEIHDLTEENFDQWVVPIFSEVK